MAVSSFKLLCATGLLAFFSSTLSKSPVLPLFAAHLGADAAGVGLIGAISPIAGVLVSIPAGVLSDRFGRRRMLLVSAWVFASAPLVYLLANSLLILGLTRLYHGLATAIFLPVALAMVSDLYQQGRGERLGWFASATMVGRFAAPLTGGLMLAGMAVAPAVAFRNVYLLCFVAGLLTLVLATLVPKPLTIVGERLRWGETFSAFRQVLFTPGILPTALVEAGILFMYGAFETFLPAHVVTAGLGAREAGLFISVQVITLALTRPIMGRFSDRHGRRGQIFWGGMGGMLAITLLAFATSFWILMVASIGVGLALSTVTSASSARIADLSRSQGRGTAMGILASLMDIGHAAGPFGAGLLAARYGIAAGFLGAATVLGGLALVFWMIPAPETVVISDPA